MRWFILALAVLAAFAMYWYDPATATRREADAQAHAALISQEAELEMQRREVLAPWWTGLSITALVLLGLVATIATLYTGALAALDIRRRATTYIPTVDGRLPIPVEMLPTASVAALGAQHARLQLGTTQQQLGAALTFDQDELAGLIETLAE